MSNSYEIKRALEAPGTMATLVHAIVYKYYGPAAYEWDPLTVYLELQADFGAECASEVTDRWSAMQVVMSTDSFFDRLDAFLAICNTLSDGTPFFEMFNPVNVEEIAWAVTEVSLNRDLQPFCSAIKVYVKALLTKEGYDENEYPDVFKQMFSGELDAKKVLMDLPETQHPNVHSVESYTDAQLAELVKQFDKVPAIGSLNKWALRHSISEYISEK